MPETPKEVSVFNDNSSFSAYLREYFRDVWEGTEKTEAEIAVELTQLQALLLERIAEELGVTSDSINIDYEVGIKTSPSDSNIALRNLTIELVVRTDTECHTMYAGINIGTAESMYDHENHQVHEDLGDSSPKLTVNAVSIIN